MIKKVRYKQKRRKQYFVKEDLFPTPAYRPDIKNTSPCTWHKIIIGDSRHMDEVEDKSVHLIITSPPYWQLKDYGPKEQIGFNDSYLDSIERLVDPKKFKFGTVIDTNGRQKREETYKVISIPAPNEIVLESGQKIKLLGVLSVDEDDYKNKAIFFLKNLISGNKIFVKYDGQKFDNAKNLLAYVYLQNKTFLNAKLIKKGLAKCDKELDFQFKDRFNKYEEEAKQLKVGIWEKEG